MEKFGTAAECESDLRFRDAQRWDDGRMNMINIDGEGVKGTLNGLRQLCMNVLHSGICR